MGLPVRVVRGVADDEDEGGTRVEAVDIVDIVSKSCCWWWWGWVDILLIGVSSPWVVAS